MAVNDYIVPLVSPNHKVSNRQCIRTFGCSFTLNTNKTFTYNNLTGYQNSNWSIYTSAGVFQLTPKNIGSGMHLYGAEIDVTNSSSVPIVPQRFAACVDGTDYMTNVSCESIKSDMLNKKSWWYAIAYGTHCIFVPASTPKSAITGNLFVSILV